LIPIVVFARTYESTGATFTGPSGDHARADLAITRSDELNFKTEIGTILPHSGASKIQRRANLVRNFGNAEKKIVRLYGLHIKIA
jgi:hypothetical protein